MQIQTPADLARLVKTRRQVLGHTQQSVADAAGITRQSLARIERGNGGVSFDTILRILDFLDVDLAATPTAKPAVAAGPARGLSDSALKALADHLPPDKLQPQFETQLDRARNLLDSPAVSRFLTSQLEKGDPDSWQTRNGTPSRKQPPKNKGRGR